MVPRGGKKGRTGIFLQRPFSMQYSVLGIFFGTGNENQVLSILV